MRAFFAIFVYLWCLIVPGYAQETLTFSAVKGHPLNQLGEQIVNEAYSQLSLQVKIKEYPLARSTILSNDGVTDGELGAAASGTRNKFPNLIQIPVPLVYVEGVAFTINTEFVVDGWESLRPYKIGIVRGTKFAEPFIKDMKVVKVGTNRAMFEILELDRVDIVVAELLVGLVALRSLDVPGVKVLEPPIVRIPLYHYVHKKHKALIPRIHEVIKKMGDQGRLATLYGQYVVRLK